MTASAREAKTHALLESQNVRYSASESSDNDDEDEARAKFRRTSSVATDIKTSRDLSATHTQLAREPRVSSGPPWGAFSPPASCGNLRKMHLNHADVINAENYD